MIKNNNRYLIFNSPKKVNIKFLLKYLLSIFGRIYYNILFLFKHIKRKSSPKYKVSLCAIFKNEADYLKEWIEYHKIVGVEHFYLYNNNSDDNYLEILEPYLEQNIITLIDWPILQGQILAYKDFSNKYSCETEWVGFIDIDEFIVPNNDETIYSFIKKFNNRPVVIIYWKYFGSSGLINRNTKDLVTNDFVLCWEQFEDLGKFFFNTKYELCFDYKRNIATHYMWAKSGKTLLPPVNLFNHVCIWGFNPVHSSNMPIQINHYVTKSYNEYIDKKSKRGGGVHPIGMHDLSYFTSHDSKCVSTDYHIFKYVTKLKLSMENSDR